MIDPDIAALIALAVYVILQMIVVMSLRGILRLLSLALAGFMVAAVGLTIDAYMDQINPWTIFLYLATPPALVLVTGLLVLGFVIPRGRPERTLSRGTVRWST